MKKNENKYGFTIIEVVLVLAIAGLIFLMVFVALPALQRSQRDIQRRQDAAKVVTALTQYMANNGGNLPSAGNIAICNSGAVGPNPTDRSDEIIPNIYNDGPVTCMIIAKYLNASDATTNEFKDPDGVTYGLSMPKPKGASAEPIVLKSFNYTFYVHRKQKCKNEETEYTGNMNDFVVLYKLEGAGTVCVDNQ